MLYSYGKVHWSSWWSCVNPRASIKISLLLHEFIFTRGKQCFLLGHREMSQIAGKSHVMLARTSGWICVPMTKHERAICRRGSLLCNSLPKMWTWSESINGRQFFHHSRKIPALDQLVKFTIISSLGLWPQYCHIALISYLIETAVA